MAYWSLMPRHDLVVDYDKPVFLIEFHIHQGRIVDIADALQCGVVRADQFDRHGIPLPWAVFLRSY